MASIHAPELTSQIYNQPVLVKCIICMHVEVVHCAQYWAFQTKDCEYSTVEVMEYHKRFLCIAYLSLIVLLEYEVSKLSIDFL